MAHIEETPAVTTMDEPASAVEEIPRTPTTTNVAVALEQRPLSRESSTTNASRRKPVPPPKDETTLPKWVLSQSAKKVKRRPVSVASYTLTLSDHADNGSVGEGTSAPKANENVAERASPVLQTVPEDTTPAFLPVLAATRIELPLRRVNSLPPYGPGPTQMYILPQNLKPAFPRTIRKKPSTIRKRWRPSPGSVRKTIVVRVKKLQEMSEATFRPAPMGDNQLTRTFGTVKRVGFQPWRSRTVKAEQPRMVEEGVLQMPTEKPPVRYLTFLKRAKTESAADKRKSAETMPTPVRSSTEAPPILRTRRKPFDAGKWIDDHFDMIRRPPKRIKSLPVASSPKGPPRWRRFTPARRATIETEDWVVVPRPPNRTLKTIRRQGKYMGNAMVKGWGRVVVVGSSVGQMVVSRVPRRTKVVVVEEVAVRPEAEATVREVMSGAPPAEEIVLVDQSDQRGGSIAESVSEQFHTDDDIIEAESVHAEEEAGVVRTQSDD